jgi:SAM-dependent methyltransferase
MPEIPRRLDELTLEVFARKGQDGPAGTRQVGLANAVKVRRVLQLVRDLRRADRPLRVLDLACGEGVYAIETALRGDSVWALDGRTERMNQGAEAAARLALSDVHFEQADIRRVNRQAHGEFDVIYLLGILYHLDAPDVFDLLEQLREMCRGLLVIDTQVALIGEASVAHRGHSYAGTRIREHEDADTPEIRRARVLASLDNTFSFVFTRESLVRVLNDVGFTSVLECLAPLEASKPHNRVTFVAAAGTPIQLSSYPWINGKSEEEIARFLRSYDPPPAPARTRGLRARVKDGVNAALRPLGLEIRTTR